MAIEQKNKGFTLIELMITLVVSSLVITGILSTYTYTVSVAFNQKIKLVAKLQADAVLQTIGSELKSLGNGVPFDQSNFLIGDVLVNDTTITYPLLISDSDVDTINFRINETGRTFILTDDFNPNFSSTVKLTDVQGLSTGDTIYITNGVIDGDDGLYATIDSVNTSTKSITLSGVDASAASREDPLDPNFASFSTGSLLEAVNTVTYDSPSLSTGILRNSGGSAVTMANNATMTFKYFNSAGTEITTLPLTELNLINDLRVIEVTVNVQSTKPLKDGSTYTATVTQAFGLRNLNYLI